MVVKTTKKGGSNAEHLWRLRWKARTDLIWLCNEVLNFKLINRKIHGPIAAKLQQFTIPTMEEARAADLILDNGKIKYVPQNDPYTYLKQFPRRHLILDPRSWAKTSLNTAAHTLQWLINYPHVSITPIFSTGSKVSDVISNAIKYHFQYNAHFRELFPEMCPKKRINDFGTQDDFSVCNREEVMIALNKPARVEPSVKGLSIGNIGTGYHFDIIKCSDLVDDENSQTGASRENIKKRFGLIPKILVHPTGWIDVEGTFYNDDDLHQLLVKDWRKKLPEERDMDIFVRAVYQRDTGEKEPRYDPNEMLLPWKRKTIIVDGLPKTQRVPTWPEKYPVEILEKEEKSPTEGGQVFANQRLLDTTAVEGDASRPLRIEPQYVTRERFQALPIAYYLTTADLADTVKSKSNPSVVTTAGISRTGRVYVCDIRRGKFTAEQLVQILFHVYRKYKPVKIAIEERGFEHGLRPYIKLMEEKEKLWLPWHFFPRDRTRDKATRLALTLQPPLKDGSLYLVDPLFSTTFDSLGYIAEHKDPETLKKASEDLISTVRDELFSVSPMDTGSTDDVIDTLADLYLVREWFGEELVRNGYLQHVEAQKKLQQEQIEDSWRRMVEGTDGPRRPYDPYSLTGW